MSKSLFINRKEELKRLTMGLKRINDFILIAPRRYGKTELAHRVLDEISKDKKFIVIKIDLMSYVGDNIKSIAEGIIEKCLNALGVMGKLRLLIKQIDFSMNIKLRYKDLELEPMLHLFKGEDAGGDWKLLEEALELPEKIAKREKKQVIVFFDEFGELANINARAIRVFRSVIQLHKNVSYLFAGSKETLMSEIFIDKKGAFYRFGELMFLKELTSDDVVTTLQNMYPDISFDVLGEILELSRCHPYYAAQIIEHFAYDKSYYADVSSFYDYVNSVLISQERSYIELQLLSIKEKSNHLQVLRLISMGLNPYTELRDIAKQNVLKLIRSLEAMGHVRQDGRGRYLLTDPILGYYLTNY